MKRIFINICFWAALTLVFSNCAKETVPGNEEMPQEPEAPESPQEPESPDEPEFIAIAPMLDIIFNADGTATDASANNFRINDYDGPALMTWKNPFHEREMARFSHNPGTDAGNGYYKFNYYSLAQFKRKMADGYSMEAIIMLDAEVEELTEIKAFCSSNQGGTGIVVCPNSLGGELVFVTNVSTTGNSKQINVKTGVTVERGRYYHIIGVWDKNNNEARVYVDGELKNTTQTEGEFNLPKSPANHWFCIGGNSSPTSALNVWRGDIAMARMYDEPLTSEWISTYYQQSIPSIPQATYMPEDVLYMTTRTVQAGGKFTIAGNGFKEGDFLEIESIDGTYQASCNCTVSDSHAIAQLPEDISAGKYKLFMKRGSELYPVGKVSLTVTDSENILKAPKIIAHRGYHKDGIPENSVQALAKAQEYGFDGSEVDVWITTDGVVVCNHDGNTSGYKIQDSSYDQIKDIKLSNGEVTPTFESMLDQLATSDKTRLILEFKTHNTWERNIALISKSLELIEAKGLMHMVDYIAPDYEVCKAVITAMPNACVGYLNGDRSPAEACADGLRCIDYNYGILNSHPTWITEAHELGMEVNVWTINSDNDLILWLEKGVDYITTDNPDRLQKLIKAFCL